MIKVKKVDVQWLGSIPGSWRLLKLKFLCDINTGSRDTQDKLPDGKYPFFVRSPHVEGLNEFSHDEEAVMTAGDGVGVGKVFHYYDGKFAAHQRVYVFTKFKNIEGKYLYYYLMSNLKFEVLMGGAKSTVDSIRRPMLSEFPIAFPSLVSQEKIIRFLDVKEAQINSLIESKEKYISLLEQQRQSIITEAVTKGLNPNVKMKDSEVEWIGEIPEHWELKRLKYALILNPSKNEVSSIENINVTFLPMENILAPNEVDISIKKKIEEVYNGYTYFKNNDLVLAKVTPCFENGNIAVMENMENGIGFGTTELHVLRPRTKQNISFYYYLAQSGPFKQQGVSTMYGVGGLKRIPNEFVLNYEFGMPPLAEQNEIVDFLNCKCREIQNAKHSIKLQIEKLKEYRQSLIYEAVTGKIDVRELELD